MIPKINFVIIDSRAGVAQLVEQMICNHQVPCSIHGAGTINGYRFKNSVRMGILMIDAV